jgi:hypothetical protein
METVRTVGVTVTVSSLVFRIGDSFLSMEWNTTDICP